MNSKLKVRQPLAGVTVVLSETQTAHREWLEAHESILLEELNVKSVEFTADAQQYVTYQVVPNFKALGPRVGKLMPQVKKTLTTADGSELLNELNSQGKVTLTIEDQTVELGNEDIEVRLNAKDGWAAAQGACGVVVLSTELTPELIREGMSRDVVRLIQDRRKEMQLEFTDRIKIQVCTSSDDLKAAIEENRDYVTGETLATSLEFVAENEKGDFVEKDINQTPFSMCIQIDT